MIDLSEADIVLIKTSETNEKSFHRFLEHVDVNSEYQKDLVSDKMHLLQELEWELTWNKHQSKIESLYNQI